MNAPLCGCLGSLLISAVITVGLDDRATVERPMAMIADLQAQKVTLHPEQKQ
jgi:hypothetical protein